MNTNLQEITAQPYHGIFINDGRKFSNWGSSRSTQPAVYAEPISYADVQAIARNTEQFPTPVRPVGSMLSVTDTVVNDGGTLLCTCKLDAILGLETDDQGGHVVRVQAGYRLAIETLGGNPSPIQTQWLQPGDVRIPRKLARSRFTTPYYQQFLV